MKQKLIDREKLRMGLRKLFACNSSLIDTWLAYTVEDVIDEQPTFDAEPVNHGEWIDGYGMVRCSECGHKFFKHNYQSKWKYCPNCGALMDLDEVNNEVN